MSATAFRIAAGAGLALALAALVGWHWRETAGPGERRTAAVVDGAPTAVDVAQSPGGSGTPPVAMLPPTTPGALPADSAPAPDAERVSPSFDVVRVEETGDSVIAGRAEPGAAVDLVRDGRPVARVAADPSGLFAIVPEALGPGTHELTLAAIAPDGTRAVSAQSVTVVISPDRRGAPLVTVTAPGRPSVVLSRPTEPSSRDDGAVASTPGGREGVATPRAVAGIESPARSAERPAAAAPSAAAPGAAASPPQPRRTVTIETVETEGEGRLYVGGGAAPGATLRLYLNDAFVAPGGTGPDGRLAFTIERGIRPGDYRVRLDDVDPVSGAVKSRVEVPFSVPGSVTAAATPIGPAQAPTPSGAGARVADASTASGTVPAAPALPRASASVIVPSVETAIVTRGDSLWQISRRVYGSGLRYTVIFGANAPQIRDPDLIYPGQVFVLPTPDPARAP